MRPQTLDYETGPPFDVALFVSRYLAVLAWLSIASMILSAVIFHSLYLDFSCLFLFWASRRIAQRSQHARDWVVGLAGLIIVAAFIIDGAALAFGTGFITVILLGHRFQNPAAWLVILTSALPILIAIVPLILLRSPSGRRQFPGYPAAKPPG
jgi:hypothetical protein